MVLLELSQNCQTRPRSSCAFCLPLFAFSARCRDPFLRACALDTVLNQHDRCRVPQAWQKGRRNTAREESNAEATLQIVAIGRNYADHVKELNNAVPKEPFFFLKPTSSYLSSGGKVEIPRGITAHHEGMSLHPRPRKTPR